MRGNYIKDSDAIILVFDLTCRRTWRELISFMELGISIKEGEFPFVLVGNKQDLGSEREVTKKDIENFKLTYWDVPYFETSAKQNSNVEEIFESVCREIIKKNKKEEKYKSSYLLSPKKKTPKKEVTRENEDPITPKKKKSFGDMIKKLFSVTPKESKKRKIEEITEEEGDIVVIEEEDKENQPNQPNRKKLKL
jgi:GTPase SAR1 family protein